MSFFACCYGSKLGADVEVSVDAIAVAADTTDMVALPLKNTSQPNMGKSISNASSLQSTAYVSDTDLSEDECMESAQTDSIVSSGAISCCISPTARAAPSARGTLLGARVVGCEGLKKATPDPERRPPADEELDELFRHELDHMQAPAAPADQRKGLIVNQLHVPDLTLESIPDALTTDEALTQYLQNFSKGWDISLSPWSTAPSGLRVRRARFMMPVPQEVPAAVARMVAVPATSKATLLVGFVRKSEGELVVLVSHCTHEVPCGESFRVQETLIFKKHEDVGVSLTKWSGVAWVNAVPFMMMPMKPITEAKTATGAVPGTDAFLKVLRDASVA